MNIVALGAGLFGQHLKKLYPDISVLDRRECDITKHIDMTNMFKRYQPDIVINAAGIVPKAPADVLETLNTNAFAPRLLADMCDLYGCRLAQLSTNDVFSGHSGNYWEYDTPSPNSLYSMSKVLGEIDRFPHLTIRSSFIGWPDDKGRGLLSWLKNSSKVIGYDKFLWNGLCVPELIKLIMTNLLPSGRCGVVHVHGQLTNKYEVLMDAREVFGWNVEIVKESETVASPHEQDRSLHSKYGIISQKSIKQQLVEMRNLWS